MGHVNALAKRGYQEGSNSPDYVVLFAPFESILSEALEVDPLLLHKSFEKGVTIATPTTMMALLRTVAFVFSQGDMAQNAVAIKDLAGELIKRIGKVHSKIATLGDRIKSTEKAFNDLIASSEENMLRPARKMVGLGVPSSNKLKAGDEIDDQVRVIKVRDQLMIGDDSSLDEDDSDEIQAFFENYEDEARYVRYIGLFFHRCLLTHPS
jgi:DNA recombination protein RmuC